MTHTTTFTTRWWDSNPLARFCRRVALLKTIKSGLILALVPFLLACENDNFLSLPADPSQQNLDIRRTRIPVPFQIVRQDSLNTSATFVSDQSSRKRLLAGQQVTELGIAEATAFVDFMSGPRAVLGDTTTYQSLELELLYERSYGATQASQQSLEVHRLVDSLSDDPNFVYYNSDNSTYASSLLGTVTTGTKLAGGLDTLRFRLDDALGQTIFDLAAAGDSTVLDGAKFREFLPGLALVPTAANRFVSSFDPVRVRLIMNFTNAQGEVKEYTFVVRRYFSRVAGDYTGTPLAGLTEAGSRVVPDDGRLYLQSGAGVAPRIKFDSLVAFVRNQTTDQQSIRLNRVDLNVGLSDVQDTLNAPPALFIYDFVPDSLGLLQRTPVPDGRGGVAGYRGVPGDQSTPPQATALVLDGTQYTLPITNYLSAVVESDTLEQRLYLWSNNFDSSLSHFVTSGDSIYLDVNYTVLTY